MPRIRLSRAVSAFVALQLALSVPARADNDFLAGVIVGGIVGGIVGSQTAKNNKKSAPSSGGKSTTTRSKPTVSAAQREENRRIQLSLASIGCDPGPADGQFGKKTRAAITCFQAAMKRPQTGTLDAEERAVLLDFYKTDVAGTPTGSQPPSGAQAVSPVIIAGGAASIFEALGRNPAPANGAGAAGTEVAGNETGQIEPMPIVAAASPVVDGDLCAAAPGGGTVLPGVALPSASPMVDGIPTVGYCDLMAAIEAEAEAIALDRKVTLAVAGQQCGALIDLTADIRERLPELAPQDALAEVGATLNIVDPAEAAQSARLCAGAGYAERNHALVEAAGLFGTASGDASMVEVVGWHYAFGLGHPANRSVAAAWLEEAAAGLSEIDPALLVMAEPDRPDNLRAVVTVMQAGPGPAASGGGVLPGLGN